MFTFMFKVFFHHSLIMSGFQSYTLYYGVSYVLFWGASFITVINETATKKGGVRVSIVFLSLLAEQCIRSGAEERNVKKKMASF